MGVVLSCLEATGHQSEYILRVQEQFNRISDTRADLTERYWKAVSERQAPEIGRLLWECAKIIREGDMLPPVESNPAGSQFRVIVTGIDNLRINGATGRFHVGNSSRSVPLFAKAH
jgi:hypothetical protein